MNNPRKEATRRRIRRPQISLGSLILLAAVAGCVAGIYGPHVARWLRIRPPVPPRTVPVPPSSRWPDDAGLELYLEPAETPLD